MEKSAMKQIRVALVDDEHLERTLIRYSFPWEENGFAIVGEADSGEDMIHRFDELRPDVIFADICMPFMNGLEMSQAIRGLKKDVEIVILTGHRDFAFAQQAIHVGVLEYLVKPVQPEELRSVVRTVRGRVERRCTACTWARQRGEAEKKYSELVSRAIQMIGESLSDCGLSLKSLSERLYVSPGYLCRTFKKETGENVTNYIVRMRIRQSLDYLDNTPLKAYEIAERVGFEDPHYFSILFKKQMGKSIQEYRRCGSDMAEKVLAKSD